MHRRPVLAGLVAVATGAVLPARGHEAVTSRDREAATATAPAFGTVIEFELRDMKGKGVRAADLRGQWLLVFFGYTRCPDVCPTTLSAIAGALSRLGALAARVRPVFVSIDPEHDTPRLLPEYVQSFDQRILPLTGTALQLTKAADACGIVFYKVPGPTPDDYTFAHNAILTLVGPEGGLVARFSSDTSADDLAGALRRLIDRAAS